LSPSAADAPRVYRVEEASHAVRQVGDESVVLDLQRSVYFALNRTGGLLWPHLVSGATRNELVSALVAGEAAPLEESQAAKEIDDFLASIEAQGLFASAVGHG
jgi:hypothetical protein